MLPCGSPEGLVISSLKKRLIWKCKDINVLRIFQNK